jgi:PAS domain S-box-containing protein
VALSHTLTMTQDFNLLFESNSESFIVLDTHGLITYANPAAFALTGYENGELTNKHFSIIYFNPDDDFKVDYELELTRKKGRFKTEAWKVRKDGSKFWAEMFICPFHKQQKVAGYTVILHDRTEKKELELSIRKNEEMYRLMVEGVQDYAIFMLDTTGHIVTWNDGAKRIKGYHPSEIIGRHFSIFYTTEDLQNNKPANELVIALRTGKYEEEGWRIKKNGSVFWASIVITSLMNERNEHIGFSKVTRDLSERKENEEHLRQSEERFRMLVEQVGDYGIFMMDERGRIISWNEGARKIKGYEEKEVVGKYFSIFYPEEDILNGKPQHELRTAIIEGKYEDEGWRLRKDGTRFWANVVITAVYNTAGALIGFSKVTRDLTERKAAEKDIRESYERYRWLADELQIANKELTDANQELEQFTSIASHDLQEPIRTIKSFLTLMDQKIDAMQTADLKNYVSKSINAANRMKELIQNLLNYSQVSKVDIRQDQVNVDDIFSEVLQNLRGSVDASKAEIIIDNKVDVVYGDRFQLVQLVQNLVSNALKFTSSEFPRIRIRTIRENGQIKFSVSDNGIGIADGDLKKVFDIFRRLDTKIDYPGTGIGLAICKKIVDRHKGEIWPESTPGKGTTFYFTINEERSSRNHHEKV